MQISIIGQAVTQFGELWDRSLKDLIQDAVFTSLIDAALEPKDVEAIFIANKAAGNFENQHHMNAIVSQLFPHFPPAMRIEGACASGSLALLAAEYALLSGQYQTVMVVGVEKMTDVTAEETTQILSGAADSDTEIGSTFPGLYGLLAQQHMLWFGTTREQLSAVAVKNHLHALKNSHAQFHKKLSIEQVSQSALIADPLRILDCSPISDGAAAVILSTKKTNKMPQLVSFGHAQDSIDLSHRDSLVSLQATTRAVHEALKRANLKIHEITIAEVHDCFTIAEILAIEDLGFFPKGEGGAATLKGLTNEDSKIWINPSGGLKACGHPVGATGVKQVAYLSELLKHSEAKYALAHNVGGSGATAVVHIIGKGNI